MILPLHVIAGGLAMVLGAVALLAPKGATLHRRAGILFVGAMLAMGFSGSLLAARHSLTNPNALGGLMSAYFVITAFTTVRPPSAWNRRLTAAASVLASAVAAHLVPAGSSRSRQTCGHDRPCNGVLDIRLWRSDDAGDYRRRAPDVVRTLTTLCSARAAPVAHVRGIVHRRCLVFRCS